MWPKTITIRGIAVQVGSMEELDEFIQRYGSDVATPQAEHHTPTGGKRAGEGSLAMNDRVILQQFVEHGSKGILNKELGKFLGARGKAIGPSLRKWSLKTGLTHQEKSEAFERFNRPDGRGFRLSETSMKIAQQLLQGH